MDSELNRYVENIAQAIISGATMEAAMNQLRFFKVPEELINTARITYETKVGIIRALRDPAALIDDETRAKTWYPGPDYNDVYWPPVRAGLLKQLSESAVEEIDNASSKILSVMDPPGVPLNTRGLVLGYVQSGKTTNFISVISKAADVGYRIFIVLSGITDSLREQTQQRVEDSLIGLGDKEWYRLTKLDQDFAESTDNVHALLSNDKMRFVAVMKKNPARLRRMREWLNTAGPVVLAAAPILVIDDEADQASVNVAKPGGRASTINVLLKQILDRPKAAYVAYTATPFANLLTNPADEGGLYPSKFIVSLPEPDGYFGAAKLFGLGPDAEDADVESDGLDVIREIGIDESDEARPPKGKGAVYGWDPHVGPALKDSIAWFLLSSAARKIRGGGNRHSTMLVHTSMLAEAHVRLAHSIRIELADLLPKVSAGDNRVQSWMRDLYLGEIARVRANEYGHDSISFETIWEYLPKVVSDTKVITDNYLSKDRLTYDDDHPSTAIVVGGNTLSRGLTLEGLSSSYFVRAASAYDTLLQMGRWFGYRRGYEDLCRVWMTDELRTWFRDLSTVESEIRQEISRYELEQLRPSQVAVRIRTHPDMAITRAAAMRDAVKSQMSYSSQRVQTILFSHKDHELLDGNKSAVARLVSSAISSGRSERTFASGRRGISGLDASDILSFIDKYNFHPNALTVTREYLRKYIEHENESGSLLKWNLVFFESPDGRDDGIDVGLPEGPLRPLNRAKLKHSDPAIANLKAIASTPDRIADVDLAPAELRRRARAVKDGPGAIPDASWLDVRGKELPDWGLLGIYPIDKDSRPKAENGLRLPLCADEDLIGVTFFFPNARREHSEFDYVQADLSYQLNEDAGEEESQAEAADSADRESLEQELEADGNS